MCSFCQCSLPCSCLGVPHHALVISAPCYALILGTRCHAFVLGVFRHVFVLGHHCALVLGLITMLLF
jgi:hypothetical protein